MGELAQGCHLLRNTLKPQSPIVYFTPLSLCLMTEVFGGFKLALYKLLNLKSGKAAHHFDILPCATVKYATYTA